MAKGRRKNSDSLIVIDKEWAIKPDAHQWQLCKRVDNKGQILWQPKKYGSLKYLITACFEMKVRTSAFSNLSDLADNIEDAKNEMKQILLDNGLDL